MKLDPKIVVPNGESAVRSTGVAVRAKKMLFKLQFRRIAVAALPHCGAGMLYVTAIFPECRASNSDDPLSRLLFPSLPGNARSRSSDPLSIECDHV